MPLGCQHAFKRGFVGDESGELHDEETQKLEQVHQAALRDLMRGVADEIITAAGGDTTKLQAAIEAGKQAALASIT